MAQLGARLNGIEEVEGSSPSGSTEAARSAAFGERRQSSVVAVLHLGLVQITALNSKGVVFTSYDRLRYPAFEGQWIDFVWDNPHENTPAEIEPLLNSGYLW